MSDGSHCASSDPSHQLDHDRIVTLEAEIDTLRAALAVKDTHDHFDCAVHMARQEAIVRQAVEELDSEHRPDWASDEMKARGKDPLGCVICWPKDSGWPCYSRSIADDLRTLIGEENE